MPLYTNTSEFNKIKVSGTSYNISGSVVGVGSGDSSEAASMYYISKNYSKFSETESSGASEEGGDNMVGGRGGVIYQKWLSQIRFILMT